MHSFLTPSIETLIFSISVISNAETSQYCKNGEWLGHVTSNVHANISL